MDPEQIREEYPPEAMVQHAEQTLHPKLLKSILRDAGMDAKEFLKFFR